MKNLKARLVTLTISAGMALAIILVAPALMGAFSQQDSVLTPREACAAAEEEGKNCCSYDAVCNLGGPTDHVGYEFYDGSCSDRDKEEEDGG